MRIFTLNDLKTKHSARPAKQVGIVNLHDGEYVQFGRHSERTRTKKRKGTHQDKDEDEDGDYHEEPDEDNEEDRYAVGVSRGKRQKQGSSKDGNVNWHGHITLTPRQMAALHWANKDFKASPTETRQAAVEKEQNEELQADQVARMNEHDGGEKEAEAGMYGAELVARKLRNGKKRDIGQRLGSH